jgi:hypothetical protein
MDAMKDVERALPGIAMIAMIAGRVAVNMIAHRDLAEGVGVRVETEESMGIGLGTAYSTKKNGAMLPDGQPRQSPRQPPLSIDGRQAWLQAKFGDILVPIGDKIDAEGEDIGESWGTTVEESVASAVSAAAGIAAGGTHTVSLWLSSAGMKYLGQAGMDKTVIRAMPTSDGGEQEVHIQVVKAANVYCDPPITPLICIVLREMPDHMLKSTADNHAMLAARLRAQSEITSIVAADVKRARRATRGR